MSGLTASLVVAVYNVARYLPDFLGSLDAQRGGLHDVEIIFIDDGSTDDSAAVIESWITGHEVAARLIRQANAGAAAARNAGLDVATGTWVSFPDPDDRYSANYLEVVREAVASDAGARAHLLATNLLILDDTTGEVRNTHPLRGKYADGKRTIDLERHPQWAHLQGGSAFYRRSVVERLGLRFDPQIRPNFEDASFTTLYLAEFERPRMLVLPAAEYQYRRRSDGTSLVQGSWRNPQKYTDLIEYGHLGLLRRIHAQLGRIPLFVQTVILYDVAWYFKIDAGPNSPTPGLDPGVLTRFRELLTQVFEYIDIEAIDAFRTTWISEDMRVAMILDLKGQRRRPSRVAIDRIDTGRRVARVKYYYAGDRPVEKFRARGYQVAPVFGKFRAVNFFGTTMVMERVAWLPATGALSVELDGKPLPIDVGPEAPPLYRASASLMWDRLAEGEPPTDDVPRRPPATLRARAGRWRRDARAQVESWRAELSRPELADEIEAAALRIESKTPLVRRRYADAWLLMDRDTQAQDNAERLYEWLREHRPDINAWFVLSRSSSDWPRLERAGFRLLDHGSRQHKLALLNCAQLLSSQIDQYVVHPYSRNVFGDFPWKYTFLQHGVTKDDLSSWINGKDIDLMLAVTPDEYESFVADGTPYRVTDREVRMTGFPRHDRLLELGRKVAPEQRTRLLVTPTWRRELLVANEGEGNQRRMRHDFWESEYAARWRSVLESEALDAAATEHGYTIEFIPHPNMQDYLTDSPLPDHVIVHRFADIDIQQMLADAAGLVTDYSSMAFEAAYLDRPVLYFQFDRDEFFSGGHAYRKGTWSYEKDGFGPVLTDTASVVEQMIALMRRGGTAEPEYAARMAATFPLRDGRCCERTVEAVLDLDRPLPYKELYRRLEDPAVLAGRPVE